MRNTFVITLKILLISFNILISLFLLFTLIMLQGPTPLFILGILYIMTIGSIIKQTFPRKLLFFGILPFSLLSSVMFFVMTHPKTPPGFKMEILHASVGSVMVFGVFLINYFVLKFLNIKNKQPI